MEYAKLRFDEKYIEIRIIIRGSFVIFWIRLTAGDENMPEKESISKFLKEYRQKNEESQFEFAANIGICVEELSKLERKIANPRLETLQKIAAYTGNEVWELVYMETGKGDATMFQMLLDKYWNSQAYRALEENEIHHEIRSLLENNMSEEAYLEYEEKLNDLIIQMEQEAFLAGCEAVLQYKCKFCSKVMNETQ